MGIINRMHRDTSIKQGAANSPPAIPLLLKASGKGMVSDVAKPKDVRTKKFKISKGMILFGLFVVWTGIVWCT